MTIVLRRCQFCGSYYEPPNFHRIPSQTCDRCYSKISEKLAREPGFLPVHARRITWVPPNPEVKQ